MKKIKAAILGCGVISTVYAENLIRSEVVDLVGCAARNPEKAKARAAQYGIHAYDSIEQMLADPEIEIVINLTVPAVHDSLNRQALEAGKHVYCEKPLATSYEEAKKTLEFAKSKGLVLCGAPDTVLGAGVQTVKKVVMDGWIGKPMSGTANFISCGHEIWHPEPDFLYKKGAGPIWDTMVYYIAAMVTCIGSVKKVSCFTKKSAQQRMIKSQPHAGDMIDVEVPTHVSGTMIFENDVMVSYTSTYDAWSSHIPNFEIYGSEGTVTLNNPIIFENEVKLIRGETVMENVKDLVGPAVMETIQSEKVHDWYTTLQLPYSAQSGNLRGLGVENLANHLLNGQDLITNGDFALHIIEVMEAMDKAAEHCEVVEVESTVPRTNAQPFDKGFLL